MGAATPRLVPTLAGAGVGLTGLGLVGVGLWARRDVRRALARERITGTGDMSPPNAPVTSAPAARSLAEVIRRRTVEAAGGRTYAETAEYVARDGGSTSDASRALTDERTGQPLTNPEYELWIRSTTLQSALMQAYLAFRLADLTTALGGALVVAGAGVAAAGRAPRSGSGRARRARRPRRLDAHAPTCRHRAFCRIG